MASTEALKSANPPGDLAVKIETASLEHGSRVRRVVYDDATDPAPDMTKKTSPSTPWAWVAGLARYVCGEHVKHPESTPEIETR